MLIENEIYKNDLESIILDKNIDWKKLKDKTILITGATGLIGTNLVNTILHANKVLDINCRIIALVRDEVTAKEKFKNQLVDNLIFLVNDIRQEIKCDYKIDYIIHAASQTSSKKFDLKNINFRDERNEIDPIQTDTTDSKFLFNNSDAIVVNLKKKKQ